MNVLVDITRTIARSRLPAPTGIDRVERAYIRWALDRNALFLGQIDGRQHIVPPETASALLEWLDGTGHSPNLDLRSMMHPHRNNRLRKAQSLVRQQSIGTVGSSFLASGTFPRMYLNVGHDNLSVDLISALRRLGVRSTVLIHDVIPLDFPDFTRQDAAERFLPKFAAAVHADGLICNSADTLERALAHAPRGLPAAVVAPLGIEPTERCDATRSDGQFLCLGTIEPRKNHAMLLEIWTRFWADRGKASPQLHIVGRRGWRNEDVFRTLDESPMMGQIVFDHGPLSDREVHQKLCSSTALLFPSLAEGYGLPVAEALAAGCPVIASDLASLREVGGGVPEWLDPSDMAAWADAIEAFGEPQSPRVAAQHDRRRKWRPPTWRDHFDVVEKHLETILVHSQSGE